MNDAQYGNVSAQQRNGDGRAAPSFQELTGAILRVYEPEPAGEAARCGPGFLAEKITG